MTTDSLRSSPPVPICSDEEESWCVQVGDNISIVFYDDGDVWVRGHNLIMRVVQDRITEERGIMFSEDK